MAEEVGATGKAALEAVIVGYEVTSRIGTGVQARAEVHSHGTWGTVGAAAATAKLLGYDAAATRQAMNLAMSMSPANTWTPCLEGATIRNLYPGRSEFQGIMAAYLGQCGFTAVDDGPTDLYSSILGEKALTRRRWLPAGAIPAPSGPCASSRTTPSTTPAVSTTTRFWTRPWHYSRGRASGPRPSSASTLPLRP